MKELHYSSKNNPFGIEAFLLEENQIVFLKYCFYLDSEMIGDIRQTCLLQPQLDVFKDIILKKNKRKFINYNIFKLNVLTNELVDAFLENNNKLGIDNLNVNSNSCECFDSVFNFLIEENSFDIFLSLDSFNKKNCNKKLPKGIFYREFEAFYQWIINHIRLTLK